MILVVDSQYMSPVSVEEEIMRRKSWQLSCEQLRAHGIIRGGVSSIILSSTTSEKVTDFLVGGGIKEVHEVVEVEGNGGASVVEAGEYIG